jgi:hypothetical protein
MLIGDLTLTRAQYPAILNNRGNRKRLTYAGFAKVCNARQHAFYGTYPLAVGILIGI